MQNQSLKESVESFIEEVNNCEDRHAIELLMAAKDLKIHGVHMRYNSPSDIEKADILIQNAVEERLKDFS